MNKSSFIQEGDSAKKTSTLVRRVSDMFKDGTYSGPPSLFSQKIRHCCQNLNLFPFLLYSFENSKSHPLAKKVNICFDLILKNFIERLLIIYTSARRAVINGLQQKSVLLSKKETIELRKSVEVSEPRAKLCTFKKEKPKKTPALLAAAIYLTPLVLLFQLIGLCSLLIFGKYTPGFIFLISSLVLLACISMKIMFHDTIAHQRKKEERRKKSKEE
ncbi:uncharacterized protein LOC131673653 [Phymastichus coffea]|uniref:uncharacterized protein LOC131673653 n=1 Tax=Phymastichus coffea TaxID=108790 RepID=UPI00273C325D|nr:uncharacterized protein LOC131673653 [Phymastichus coffea]XP_058807800.1 uncharacterized protein LOC131673653 [Phymastichus coffea]